MKGYDEINEVEKDSKNLKVPASAKFPNAYQPPKNSIIMKTKQKTQTFAKREMIL